MVIISPQKHNNKNKQPCRIRKVCHLIQLEGELYDVSNLLLDDNELIQRAGSNSTSTKKSESIPKRIGHANNRQGHNPVPKSSKRMANNFKSPYKFDIDDVRILFDSERRTSPWMENATAAPPLPRIHHGNIVPSLIPVDDDGTDTTINDESSESTASNATTRSHTTNHYQDEREQQSYNEVDSLEEILSLPMAYHIADGHVSSQLMDHDVPTVVPLCNVFTTSPINNESSDYTTHNTIITTARPMTTNHYHQDEQEQQFDNGVESLAEIGPNNIIPFRNHEKTLQYVMEGGSCTTTCLNCSFSMICCDDVKYVLCPECQIVSPIPDPSSGHKENLHKKRANSFFRVKNARNTTNPPQKRLKDVLCSGLKKEVFGPNEQLMISMLNPVSD